METNTINTEACFNLGYGGWCLIYISKDGKYVNAEDFTSHNFAIDEEAVIMFQVTSARVSQTLQVPSINSYYLPRSDEQFSAKSSIRLGHGIFSFDGQISFQVTQGTLKLLSNNALPTSTESSIYGEMFLPTTIFHVQFFDGKNTCTVYNCAWTGFSINCQPGALVTASLTFMSNNGYSPELLTVGLDLRPEYCFVSTDLLIPYWQTGSSNMIQFQISFNKVVVPAYLNNRFFTPTYLRQGLITVNLSATYLDKQQVGFEKYLQIRIGNKIISFNELVLQNHTYNMSNMQSQGQKTYQWNAISLDNKQPVFYISSDEWQ